MSTNHSCCKWREAHDFPFCHLGASQIWCFHKVLSEISLKYSSEKINCRMQIDWCFDCALMGFARRKCSFWAAAKSDALVFSYPYSANCCNLFPNQVCKEEQSNHVGTKLEKCNYILHFYCKTVCLLCPMITQDFAIDFFHNSDFSCENASKCVFYCDFPFPDFSAAKNMENNCNNYSQVAWNIE